MSVRMYKIGRGTADVLYCTRFHAEEAVASWFPMDTAIAEVYVLSVEEHEEFQRLRANAMRFEDIRVSVDLDSAVDAARKVAA